MKDKKRKLLKKLFLIDDVQCIANNYKNKWRTSRYLRDFNGACIHTKSMLMRRCAFDKKEPVYGGFGKL